MKKLMSVVVGLLIATSAYAGGWGVSVNIGFPIYTPASVVYAPSPVVYTSQVYIPRPVYYAPAPVVYVPAPIVYPPTIGIGCPTPVTVQFPVVYHHHHYFRR